MASDPITHIAGLNLQTGSWVRQRCAWCGVIITEVDLARLGPEQSYKIVEIGRPVQVTIGAFMTTLQMVEQESVEGGGFKLPENACMKLPPELTRSVEGFDPV